MSEVFLFLAARERFTHSRAGSLGEFDSGMARAPRVVGAVR
jgi:hypothetical protein